MIDHIKFIGLCLFAVLFGEFVADRLLDFGRSRDQVESFAKVSQSGDRLHEYWNRNASEAMEQLESLVLENSTPTQLVAATSDQAAWNKVAVRWDNPQQLHEVFNVANFYVVADSCVTVGYCDAQEIRLWYGSQAQTLLTYYGGTLTTIEEVHSYPGLRETINSYTAKKLE